MFSFVHFNGPRSARFRIAVRSRQAWVTRGPLRCVDQTNQASVTEMAAMTTTGSGGLIDGWRRYVAHDDSRTAVANTVALLVASNQPFYPLYLYWAVSPTVWPAFVTFLSTPLFLAVPALARRNALIGRATLMVAGIGNTLLCRFVFGAASGVDAFLMPCIVLSIMLFRRSERMVGFAFAALCYGIYLVPDAWMGAPFYLYKPDELAAFQRLNFLSAAGLTAVLALMFANAFEAEPRSGR